MAYRGTDNVNSKGFLFRHDPFEESAKIGNNRSRKEERAMMKCKLFATCALLAGTLLGSWSFPAFAMPKFEIHGNVRFDAIWMDRITKFPEEYNTDVATGSPDPLVGNFGPGTGSAFPGVPQWSVPWDDADGAFNQSQFIVDARYSRLYATADDVCCGIKIHGKIEFDFNNIEFANFDGARWANDRHLRLRLAYARADYCDFFLVAGQDWTKFQNLLIGIPFDQKTGIATIIDFNGWAGYGVARQPQLILGYTMPVSLCGCDKADLIILGGIEKTLVTLAPLQTNGDCTSIDSGVRLDRVLADPIEGGGFDLPMFVGKVGFYHYLPFQAEIGIAGTRNRVILADEDPNCPDNESLLSEGGQRHSSIYKRGAWGVQATVQSEFNHFVLYAHYQHLDGLQRFGLNEFPDATFAAGNNVIIPGEYDAINPSFHNVRSNGWYVGASYKYSFHEIDDTLFNVVYGHDRARRINNSDFSPSAVFRTSNDEIAFDNSQTRIAQRLRSLNVGIIHKFWCDWQAGIEYKRWDTKAFSAQFRNFDGNNEFSARARPQKGHVSMVMACVWYIF